MLTTNGGPVAVATAPGEDGRIRATLTTLSTWVREPEPALLSAALALLGWRDDELDPALPPAVGFAGASHLILAARDLDRLARLDYPFEALQALMLEHDLTTIQLVWRESPDRGSGRATRSRSVASSRTPRPGLPPRRSVRTCVHAARSRRRPRSRSSRASRWAGRAG